MSGDALDRYSKLIEQFHDPILDENGLLEFAAKTDSAYRLSDSVDRAKLVIELRRKRRSLEKIPRELDGLE